MGVRPALRGLARGETVWVHSLSSSFSSSVSRPVSELLGPGRPESNSPLWGGRVLMRGLRLSQDPTPGAPGQVHRSPVSQMRKGMESKGPCRKERKAAALKEGSRG